MSFFILAAVLAWSGYQALQHHAQVWRVAVDLFAAAAAVTLGVAGTRAKHADTSGGTSKNQISNDEISPGRKFEERNLE